MSSRNARAPGRQGVLLIIVAGIAAMLIALATSFFAWMQQDAREAQQVLLEAQARVMLHAGLAYIQEGSLLGWAPAGGEAFTTFGWTDVRDGSLGPRPPRPAGVSGATPVAIPAPTWWSSGYVPYPSDAQLPPVSSRTWPCPGAVMRGGMAAWELPPHAVEPVYAPNPIRPPAVYRHDDPGWDDPYTTVVADWTTAYADPTSPHFAFDADTGALGMLDPQPVRADWAGFVAGDPTPRSGTQDRGWFRVYRELLSDHDGDGRVYPGADTTAAPVPWVHDAVALHDPSDPAQDHKNWNVFLVTCGAGPTRGHRFWDSNEPGFSRAVEPITAQESGLFPDRATFESMRRSERIMWFRVEWSPDLGGTMEAARTHERDNTLRNEAVGADVMTFGGNFKWIQRLDRVPPTW